MPQFFLEILQEDIPARMQVRAAEDLKRLVTERLDEAGLAYDSAYATSSPRRLVLVIEGLPSQQPDKLVERKGPRVGSPEGALAGFLKASGLASIDQAEIRGEFYFASRSVPGRPTPELLTELVPSAMAALPWPKSMRWGENRVAWVRPLASLVALLDGQIVPLAFELSPGNAIVAGDTTRGHRFLSPDLIPVTGWADYKAKLKEAKVLVDRPERQREIIKQLNESADLVQLLVESDDDLMEEVTGLVEWPVVHLAAIDAPFMQLPVEVRRTTMRANQKYFTLHDRAGDPAARFALVANMETTDGGKTVIGGNERVLRARLSDARFFWEQDLKTPLHARREQLGKVTFHAKLGTMADKVARMEKLGVELATHIPGAEATFVLEAARLAKNDLLTGMVGEFPELQGVIGRYYALAENSGDKIADAIRDHYKPVGPSDTCPSAPVSVAVALADKLDTLAGFFSIGELPTGSKDPFALRRAALGVIRLIVENGLRLPLLPAFAAAAKLHGVDKPTLATELMTFFADRLKVTLKEQGIRHDLVDAVFALGGEDDLVRLLARVRALQEFLETEGGANLLAAYRRATNIVRIEEKKNSAAYDGAPDPALLSQDEEKTLHTALDQAENKFSPLLAAEDWTGCMRVLSELRAPVDLFFDKVTVNADQPELRLNRLRLLSRLRSVLNKIADFTSIQG